MKKKNNNHAAGGPRSVIKAATDAAVEIGAAAEALQESWEHVKKARAKGERAARPVVKAGKKVVKAATRTAKAAVKKVTGTKKRR